MRLQLIVVETGEKWRRALLRMVLEPKSSGHNDYGSFASNSTYHHPNSYQLGEQENGSLDLSEPTHDHGHPTQIGVGHRTPSVRGDGGMANQCELLYQRQPLLPANNSQGEEEATDFNDAIIPIIDDDSSDDDDRLHLPGASGAGGNPGDNSAIKIDLPPPLRQEPRFPKEKWKTFIAFLILVVNFIFTTCSLALVHERVPDRDKYPPLSDIVLDHVAPADWALSVSEILIMVATNAAVLVVFFHKHRFIVMRRIFLILALLYMMRSITMFVTVLPVASRTYYCSPKSNSTSGAIVAKRVWQLISGFGLSINGKHTYCGDYIYSGHTVILVMSYLIISEYSPRKLFPLHWLSWAVSFTGIILVLAAHGHYTVDVLIAYYVTTTLFWIYHTLANYGHLKQISPNNFLSRMWWFRIFVYLERNVAGPVPRQYDWPFSWPRRFKGKHPNRNS